MRLKEIRYLRNLNIFDTCLPSAKGLFSSDFETENGLQVEGIPYFENANRSVRMRRSIAFAKLFSVYDSVEYDARRNRNI